MEMGGSHEDDRPKVAIMKEIESVMAVKVIILDFDGVIVESTPIKDKAFEILFQKYPQHLTQIMNYHLSHNAIVRFKKFKFITEKILKKKYTKALEKKLGNEFSQLVFNRIIRCPYVKGAQGFLNYFYKKIPLYLASVNPPKELNKILKARGLTKYFRGIYAVPWRKKDAILDILRKENAEPLETIFIGDSPEDYLAAKATNVVFIGRDRKKSFNGARIPIYKNFVGIKRFLLNEMADNDKRIR